MSFFKRSWHGEQKLWKIFWAGVLFPQLIGLVIGFFVGAILAGQGRDFHDETLVRNTFQGIIDSLPYLLGVFVYYVLLAICVWRCAFNINHKFWGYLARVVIILLTLAAFGSLIGGLTKPAATPAAPQPVAVVVPQQQMPSPAAIPQNPSVAPAQESAHE